jgi:hypothetical protein
VTSGAVAIYATATEEVVAAAMVEVNMKELK